MTSARRHVPDWYAERPEPERLWSGRLERRSAPVGPGSRGGLRYELVGDERIPIYAPHLGEGIESLVGRIVMVTGKQVDLTGEGGGLELWPPAEDAFEPRPG